MYRLEPTLETKGGFRMEALEHVDEYGNSVERMKELGQTEHEVVEERRWVCTTHTSAPQKENTHKGVFRVCYP